MIWMIWKYLKTVLRHKWIVFRECALCGLFWQGLMHDMSKFSLTEFIPSVKYFQGSRSPIDAEKEDIGYSVAWLHHMGHNPHHWEYWIDFDNKGELVVNKIQYKYVEMICDWVGAGIVYNKGSWKQSDTLDYYNKVRAGRHFEEKTEGLILKFLNCIADNGLSAFHAMARDSSTRQAYER